jgi:hypothetical protein
MCNYKDDKIEGKYIEYNVDGQLKTIYDDDDDDDDE